jgi:hypothetical protein
LGKRKLNVSPKQIALGDNVSSHKVTRNFWGTKEVPQRANEIPQKTTFTRSKNISSRSK